MSHVLVKIIDIALLPAALTVVGKFVGLLITVNLFQLNWSARDVPENLLTIRPVLPASEIITASTYSDIIMYGIVALGFSYVLLQATHFHDTHIKPSTLVKLSNNNLLGLVKSSFDIYHTAGVWTIFLWLATGLVGINTLLQRTESWVAILTFIASATFTTLLLQDVYREIDLSRRGLGQQEAFT